MKVVVTGPAEADLAAIAAYIAKDDPIRARSFVNELVDACLDLADFPDRFPMVERYERKQVRRRVHGNYSIFYRTSGETIQILHILHGARDHERILSCL